MNDTVGARATGAVTNAGFRPAPLLGNRHVQSVLGGLPPLRRPRVVRERWELPDGDFLDLDWVRPTGTSWALVLPGLTGGPSSAYALRLLRRLARSGYRAALLNYRGLSGAPNRLAASYHAGFTRDLDLVAHRLANRYGPGMVAGYSMGGNLLLKWLGEAGTDAPVRAAAAASVPFELAPAAQSLRDGPARPYDRYLLSGLRRHVRRKQSRLAGSIVIPPLHTLRSIFDFDEHVTAPLHGFVDAADYYARASCRAWLRHIRVPTLIVNALDDPLVPVRTLPGADELGASVQLELARRGGHVGFVAWGPHARLRFWLEARLGDFLTAPSRASGKEQGLGEHNAQHRN